MPNHNVPRTMSTQHPDNVNIPFFAQNGELGGDDEIKEAFYAYSHIHCPEQLWDCEGKEVDNFVVKKLLNQYEPYFRRKVLGKDLFLTLRVPNPSVEKNEAKILVETLHSIPRNFDTAQLFYGTDVAPIFEVAIPMTTDYRQLVRVSSYYREYVVEKQHQKLAADDISIAQWVGQFRPEKIRVIPLVEDKDTLLNIEPVVEGYIKHEKTDDYQRVWLARSDPALNYGNLATVLTLKITLQRLNALSEKLSVDLLPILGCGSAPFRGNFKPTNVTNCLSGYPSVHTFTLQSAFKYDYPIADVTKAVDKIVAAKPKKPTAIDEKKTLPIIEKLTAEYQKSIKILGPYINELAPYVPSRRKRKLHIGLFGYSRKVGALQLPRAITFCAALYSYGLPPEIIGLHTLSPKELEYVRDVYGTFDEDLRDALQYLNTDNLTLFPKEIQKQFEAAAALTTFETEPNHKKITSIIVENYKNKDYKVLTENITRAGFVRGFLG